MKARDRGPSWPLVLAAVIWLTYFLVGLPWAWDREAEQENRAREAHIGGIDR